MPPRSPPKADWERVEREGLMFHSGLLCRWRGNGLCLRIAGVVGLYLLGDDGRWRVGAKERQAHGVLAAAWREIHPQGAAGALRREFSL